MCLGTNGNNGGAKIFSDRFAIILSPDAFAKKLDGACGYFDSIGRRKDGSRRFSFDSRSSDVLVEHLMVGLPKYGHPCIASLQAASRGNKCNFLTVTRGPLRGAAYVDRGSILRIFSRPF